MKIHAILFLAFALRLFCQTDSIEFSDVCEEWRFEGRLKRISNHRKLIDNQEKLERAWQQLRVQDPLPTINFKEQIILVQFVPFFDSNIKLFTNSSRDSIWTIVENREVPRGHWWNTNIFSLIDRDEFKHFENIQIVEHDFKYGVDSSYFPPKTEFLGAIFTTEGRGRRLNEKTTLTYIGNYATKFNDIIFPHFITRRGKDTLYIPVCSTLEFAKGAKYDVVCQNQFGWPSTCALLIMKNDSVIFQGVTDWELGRNHNLDDMSPFRVTDLGRIPGHFKIFPFEREESHNVLIEFSIGEQSIQLVQGETKELAGYEIDLPVARDDIQRGCVDCGTNDISYTITRLSNKRL